MSLRSRACLACYGIGSIFTVLSARLVYLGVNRHEHYADIARKSYMAKAGIPARRGTIQDAEGTFLARNEPLKNVILDGSLVVECKHNRRPEQLKTPEQVAALLAESLGMKAADVLDRINPAKKYVVLKKKISEELAAALDLKLQRAGVKGVTFEQDFERVYPAHQMLCHVLGFYGYEETNAETHEGGFRGIEGVERSMDSWLRGQDGWRYFEKDGRGKELMNYTGEERAPRHGADVRLTVNLNLQQIVESELESACRRLRPIKATVIMMRPDTGEILALANRPTFDPNEPGKAKPEHRLNLSLIHI